MQNTLSAEEGKEHEGEDLHVQEMSVLTRAFECEKNLFSDEAWLTSEKHFRTLQKKVSAIPSHSSHQIEEIHNTEVMGFGVC